MGARRMVAFITVEDDVTTRQDVAVQLDGSFDGDPNATVYENFRAVLRDLADSRLDLDGDDLAGNDLTDEEALRRIESHRPCLDADTTDADLAEWARVTIIPTLEQKGLL